MICRFGHWGNGAACLGLGMVTQHGVFVIFCIGEGTAMLTSMMYNNIGRRGRLDIYLNTPSVPKYFLRLLHLLP